MAAAGTRPAGGREGRDGVSGPVPRVGLFANLDKGHALQLCVRLVGYLRARGVEVLGAPDLAGVLGAAVPAVGIEELARSVPFALVLGGDGTLLAAARRVAPHGGLPLLGINLGHLGFLTELEEGELFGALPGLLAGAFEIDERMLLECSVHADGAAAERYLAVNDIVVAKGPFARLVRISLSAGAGPVAGYHGDGIIVSTPTGSTAYSLSAGGPVLHPQVQGMLVTPICPHTFYSRPLVVAVSERLRLDLHVAPGPHGQVDVALTVDAQEGRLLRPGEWVEVSVAPGRVRLLRRPGWNFYQVLRRKLSDEDRQGLEGGGDAR